jgi:hypothetical protein
MNRSYLPHIDLIDKLQLGALHLANELPILKSMLNWAKEIGDKTEEPKSLAWMISNQALLTSPQIQIEKIKIIREETNDFGLTLKEIMQHILEFSEFKPIEKILIEMQKSYNEIPFIEGELNLLAFNTDLLENKDLVRKLIEYLTKVQKIIEHTSNLKKCLLENIISNLSYSPTEKTNPLSRTEIFKINLDN